MLPQVGPPLAKDIPFDAHQPQNEAVSSSLAQHESRVFTGRNSDHKTNLSGFPPYQRSPSARFRAEPMRSQIRTP